MPLKTRLTTLHDKLPEPGTTLAIAPGVNWVCMPLPFLPAFINCWLLESETGFTLVDTGVNNEKSKILWKAVLEKVCRDKPLQSIIVSHYHPDHIGLAGWFASEYGAELLMSQTEWLAARALFLLNDRDLGQIMVDFYHRCGCEEEFLNYLRADGNSYARTIAPVPHSFIRLESRQQLRLTNSMWTMQCSAGHSPAQVTLYNEQEDLLIAADQILPHISPNISVWPDEPFANPLQYYLESLKDFERFGPETIMLPAHGYPTKNIPQRLLQLTHHHDERLEIIYNACNEPRTATEISAAMLGTEIGMQHIFFAVGEALAHLNYLHAKGEIVRFEDDTNIWRYRQTSPK